MRECDIMDAVQMAIDNTIFKEWRHEGGLLGWSSGHVNFEIDGKEYVLVLREVKKGESWEQYLEG